MTFYLLIMTILVVLSLMFDGYKHSIDSAKPTGMGLTPIAEARNFKSERIIYITNSLFVKEKTLYFLVYLVLVCLLGFSRDLGGDKIAYIEMYDDTPSWDSGWNYISDYLYLNIFMGYMPLWVLLNITIKSIYPSDFTLFQFVHAAFILAVYMRFFAKYNKYKFLCVLLLFIFKFFFLGCEIMRESMAIAFFVLAFEAMLEKRWLKYILLSFLALGFHISAIVAVLLPLIPRVRFTLKKYLVVCLLSVALYVVTNVALAVVTSMLSGSEEIAKYAFYFDKGANFNWYLGNAIIYVFVPGALVFLHKYAGNEYQEWQCVVIDKCLVLFPLLLPLLLTRFYGYFCIFTICIYADFLCQTILKKGVTFPWGLLVALVIFINVILFYFNPIGKDYRYDVYVPYTSVFDNINTSERKIIHQVTLRNQEIDMKASK